MSHQGTRVKNFFYAFHSTFCHSNKVQIRNGFDCTLGFQRRLCPSPTPHLHFLQARPLSSIGTEGLSKKCAGTVCNKTLFQSTYVTLSIKMNVSPLYILILQSCTCENTVVFERGLEQKHWTQRAALREMRQWTRNCCEPLSSTQLRMSS